MLGILSQIGVGEMLKKTSNKRYRLLLNDKKNYLIDSDTNLIVILFPWLIWLFSFKAFEVKDIRNFEIDTQKKEGKVWFWIPTTTVLSIIMIRLVPAGFYTSKLYPNHELFLTFIIVSIIILLFLFRLYMSKQKLYKGAVVQSVKIRLSFIEHFKSNLRQIIIFSAGFVISSLFLIELFKSFIIGGNPIILTVFLMVYAFILFANQTIQAPISYEIKIEKLNSFC